MVNVWLALGENLGGLADVYYPPLSGRLEIRVLLLEAALFEEVRTQGIDDVSARSGDADELVQRAGGRMTYSEDDGEIFLGRSVTQHKLVSDETAHAIDEEVRIIIDTAYKLAKSILNDNVDKLHAMAKALIKYETIDHSQIKDIMEGREPQPPEDWDDSVDAAPPADTPKSESKPDAPTIGGPATEN